MTVYVQLSSNFYSCPERLREGIGQNYEKTTAARAFGHLNELYFILSEQERDCGTHYESFSCITLPTDVTTHYAALWLSLLSELLSERGNSFKL